MTDEDLLEAAKSERCSPDLVTALAERLEDVLAEAAAFKTDNINLESDLT